MLELEEILNNYHLEYKVKLQFLDIGFTVKTNSEELALKLTDYYSGWERAVNTIRKSHVIHAVVGQGILDWQKLVDLARRPGKQVKEAYYDTDDGRIVLKKRTGVVIYLVNSERYLVGDLLKNMNQLVNQINEVFIQELIEQGYLLLHASAVVNSEGQGVAFCSESGVGKSTVAVASLEYGLKFLSNDRVLMKVTKDTVHLVGIPKKPRVNPGTILAIPSLHNMLSPDELTRYSSMDKEELWHLESKHDVEVNDIYGLGTLALRGTLGIIYLLDWKRTGTALHVETVSPEEGHMLLKPNVLNLNPQRKQYNDSQQIEAHLHRLSRRVKLYRIQGGIDIIGLCRLVDAAIINKTLTGSDG